MTRIGVLALQGDVREHVRALAGLDVAAVPVRRPSELAELDGLIMPGGESTTMIKLAATFELLEPLRDRVRDGLAVFGSCAGMILMADRLVDGTAGQETIGGLDVTVRRNAFGRQVDSFEGSVEVAGMDGPPMHAVFIRAPWVESVGPRATVLGRVDDVLGPAPGAPVAPVSADPAQAAAGRVVVVRQGRLLATAFHPELTGDTRLHELFVRLVRSG